MSELGWFYFSWVIEVKGQQRDGTVWQLPTFHDAATLSLTQSFPEYKFPTSSAAFDSFHTSLLSQAILSFQIYLNLLATFLPCDAKIWTNPTPPMPDQSLLCFWATPLAPCQYFTGLPEPLLLNYWSSLYIYSSCQVSLFCGCVYKYISRMREKTTFQCVACLSFENNWGILVNVNLCTLTNSNPTFLSCG